MHYQISLKFKKRESNFFIYACVKRMDTLILFGDFFQISPFWFNTFADE